MRLAKGLEKAGFKVEPESFFDTITVDVGLLQRGVLQAAVREGINLRRVGETRVGITLDECTRPATIEKVWRAFGIVMADDDLTPEYRLPEALLRTSAYLEHPIFHMNRAETEMMRYMRRLADRDLALDRAMIPLGSCTMKLNAAAEMEAISWREFARIHPFAPADQALGYAEIIDDLSAKLCDITGYAAFSIAAEFGRAGGICRASDHRRLAPGARQLRAQGLPDPDVGARDQPRFGPDGGMEGGACEIDRDRRHRHRRLPRQGRGPQRRTRGLHDHLPLDPRRLRGDGTRGL